MLSYFYFTSASVSDLQGWFAQALNSLERRIAEETLLLVEEMQRYAAITRAVLTRQELRVHGGTVADGTQFAVLALARHCTGHLLSTGLRLFDTCLNLRHELRELLRVTLISSVRGQIRAVLGPERAQKSQRVYV